MLSPATLSAGRRPYGSAWSLLPGDVIAPGRAVVRRLAGGGAHEVFVVEAAGSRHHAVAKLPRPHLKGDAHCLLRLRDEGAALQRLAHPLLPAHLDTVLNGRFPHLLLEHVPGPTLNDLIAERTPLEPSHVAWVGSEIAGALDHIAAAGWVHLDVKPANIMLDARPRLIDFELARPADDAALMTRPAGTWAYMPPEQRAAGIMDARLGPPADVFALATSLHEALAGRPLPRPSVVRPALAGPVGALLGAAVAPAPEDRPTAAELAAGLAPWADRPEGRFSSPAPGSARRR